jgi:HK97 family phage major capsid protein
MSRARVNALNRAKAVLASAREEGRSLTSSEYELIEAMASMAENQDVESEIKAMGERIGAPAQNQVSSQWVGGNGPGDVFVASQGFKSIQDASTRPQTWSTGMVEVSSVPLELKGTLTQTTGGGPGGGLIPPHYEPGVVSKLFESVRVRDILGQSQTTASQVRYVVEGTATSGAAGVAEGGTKPESTLGYSEVTEPVRKIATALPISDEMLDDAPSIQSYLNERLSLFVAIEEERQLLRGTGTNELVGLFNRAGAQAINTYTRLAADDNSVALAKVLANTAGSAQLQPDFIVLHPNQWLSTRLLRDGAGGTAGAYLGGGPFGQPYGGPTTGLFGGSLWGVPVILSSFVGAGTALVGNSQAAHIWRRGGVSVEATNSHSTYFVQNLTMVRSESREAFGVYRPSAFTSVSGLT